MIGGPLLVDLRVQIVGAKCLQLTLVFELKPEVTVQTGVGLDDMVIQVATLRNDVKRSRTGLKGCNAAPVVSDNPEPPADFVVAHETDL